MATRKTNNKLNEAEADFSQVAKEVFQVALEEEMEKSFLAYSYLTIEERSIPDARDGMKPVQRRIMYTMHEGGNTPDKQHVKSAKIVGSCMGTYHPHGDSAIYDAMVRLAQDFTLMTPLVDGRGNFGDRPGAGAASSRYTEARLSKEALFLTTELRERPVDFVPNYDQTTDQPAVLPVQYPFMTINGASGIAVGFATNMAPHNPSEVIDATRWLLTHPNADLDKLMTFVPGPDFPTGCQVLGVEGIREAYETGQGKVTMRAPYRIEATGRGRNTIVFYELPYEVNSEKIMEQIKDGIKNQKLQGISDVKDLTDRRNGIRFVVETKTGVNPQALVGLLYKMTALETGFSFNNIALVDGRPTLLGLKEQLEIFIAHRINVVTRRTQHRKDKKDARLHILEGMLKALANIDEVIRIIRAAPDAATAQTNLMKKFKIDEIQADYILGIPLRRLTKFDQIELNEEKIKLTGEVAELAKILADDTMLRKVISDELAEVKKQIHRDRRSVLIDGKLAEQMIQEVKEAAKAGTVEIADEPCFISLSHKGSIIRSAKAPRNTKSTIATTTRGRFVAVTDKGNAFRIDALHVGEKAAAAGSVLPSPLPKGEKVIALAGAQFEDGKTAALAIGTKQGIVKVQDPKGYPKTQDEFSVITLAEGDEILGMRWMEKQEDYDFVFIKSSSNLLTFPASSVRAQGALTAGGVAGVKIVDGEEVIDFSVVSHEEKEAGALVVSVSDMANAKFTPLKNYPPKGRGSLGVRTLKFNKGEGEVVYSTVALNPVLVTADGTTLEALPTDEKRDASGKPLGGTPVRQ